MKGFKNSSKMHSGFSYPSSFGFTGSTGRTQNISYTRRTPKRKMANGGQVEITETPRARIIREPGFPPRRDSKLGALSALQEAMRPKGGPTIRDRQIDEMSKRKGGKVCMAEGGRVKDTGLHGPVPASSEVDAESGVHSPLRPKFKKGGANWIKGAIKHPGALHRALGVPEGKKIPAKKLSQSAHSKNPTMRRRAALAKTLGRMHKAEGGKVHSDAAQDRPMMQKIASQTLAKHVATPAPRGHKGLKSC